MTTGREEVGMIIAKGRIIGSLVRKEKNITAIGQLMYEKLVEMAREGADVNNILMRLPVVILVETREFAEEICKDAVFRNAMDEIIAKRLGKPQNKSVETQPADYTKTVGKPQNKSVETQPADYTKTVGKPQNNLDESLCPDNTDLIDDLVAKDLYMPSAKKEARIQERDDYLKRRAFEVMQDIHVKDGVFLCYDKTIIAALNTPQGVFLGTNGIKKQPSQHMCPRKGQSINQGYEKCVEKCLQPSHAELAALLKYKEHVAEPDFANSYMVVYGAKEVCHHCKKTLELVGIRSVTVKPLNQLGELNGYQ